MSRIGLGRHSRLDDAAGDPLDGLVNLFDVGIVLAVAFLIAGLGLTRDPDSGRIERERAPAAQARERTAEQQRRQTVPLPAPSGDTPATGRGQEVGTVYRLPDGRLVYVKER
ncbi:MAG TPA: DUF2149 domain-containing protein [Conexibacter sp.]|nr:DUF2149 domain-containing protein [Conexibacter sp.]